MDYLRGDIFYVKKKGVICGVEQEAGRPAVIVSNDTGNRFSDAVEVVYLTSKNKTPLPTHVSVMCTVPSTALCEQVWTVSKERLDTYVRSCTDKEMQEIDRALMVSLGLGEKPDPSATIENSMIEELKARNDDLMMKLEGAEREAQDRAAENSKLFENLREAETAARKCAGDSEDVIRLKTERDLYKNLYEMAFERMLAK